MGKRLKDVNLTNTNLFHQPQIVDIQHAHCPNGCDLMTDKVKKNGLKTIAVKIRWQDKEGMIYLDPEFGSYDNVMDFEIPPGEIVQFYCPHCGISLQHEHDLCRSCSAPTFAMELPGEGQIIGCLRKGCFEHTLKIESFAAMQLRMEENFIRMIM
jgi:predicted RNA-binding Zn-ribbon protein involved in translation (DUF1610 family)